MFGQRIHSNESTTTTTTTSSTTINLIITGSSIVLSLYYIQRILSVTKTSQSSTNYSEQAATTNTNNTNNNMNDTNKLMRRRKIHKSVLDQIGNTPLMKIESLSKLTGCTIFIKCEYLNPGGSVKDRVALQIIKEAIERKKLNANGLITEGTAGSTGVSLAMVASVLGLNCHVVMPDDAAMEKSAQVIAYGATVERVRPVSITNEEHFVNIAKNRAEEMNKLNGEGAGYFADQFENLANFRAHYNGTGKEIYEQTFDEKGGGNILDAFICASGTGGTLAGCAAYLQKMNPRIKCYAADPQGSGIYNKVARGVMFSTVEREGTRKRNPYDTITEGVGINRITKNNALVLEPEIAKAKLSGAYQVTDAQAVAMSRWLCARDGVFLGSSSAVNLCAAVMLAKDLGEGKVICTIACDSGSRHLSKFWNSSVLSKHEGLTAAAQFGADLDLLPSEFLENLLANKCYIFSTDAFTSSPMLLKAKRLFLDKREKFEEAEEEFLVY